MVITINNTALDLPAGFSIVKSGKSFRFSEQLATEWTTSATLPKTSNNLTLLGVADMLDGSEGTYSRHIPIVADTGAAQLEGYARVDNYTEDGIEVSFFIAARCNGDIGKKLWRILQDDHNTVMFTAMSSPATSWPSPISKPVFARCTGNGWWDYPAYAVNVPDGAVYNHLAVCTLVDGLLDRLSAALGYPFEHTNTSLAVVSSRRKCMAANGRQVVYLTADNSQTDMDAVKGGVCVCNDYDGGDARGIVYNRTTRITRIALHSRAWPQPNCQVSVAINGNTVWTGVTIPVGTSTNTTVSAVCPSTPITVNSGDVLDVIVTYGTACTGAQAILELEQEWDEVRESDWDTDMGWTVQKFKIIYSQTDELVDVRPALPPEVSGTYSSSPSAYEYNFLGAMANLPDITLGEFLTAIGWVIGKKPKWDGWQWVWAVDDVYGGDLVIDAAQPLSENLGKSTIVGYKNGRQTVLDKKSDWLDDEKWAYKSVFSSPTWTRVGADLGIVKDGEWKGDEVFPLVTLTYTGGEVHAALPLAVRKMGMDKTVPVTLTGRAKADLTDYDYITFAGKSALLVSHEWDSQTGVSEFVAILCADEVIPWRMPYELAINPVVPGCTEVDISFFASNEAMDEVPVVDFVTGIPGSEVNNYAVQLGENTVRISFPTNTPVEFVFQDSGAVYPPTIYNFTTGSNDPVVVCEVQYVYYIGDNIPIVGFSIKGISGGENYNVWVEDESGTVIQSKSVVPWQDSDGLWVYDSKTGGEEIKAGPATSPTLKLCVSSNDASAEVVFGNPAVPGVAPGIVSSPVFRLYRNVSGTAGKTSSPYRSTKWDVTDPTIEEYADGMVVVFTVPVAGIGTYGDALQINSLGYKPVVYGASSTVGTRYPVGGIIVAVYNATQAANLYFDSATATLVTGCWQVMDYDANTNTIGYQLRTNSSTRPVSSTTYRYRLLFSSLDNTEWVPATNSTSTNATSARTVNQEVINPFGRIVYYGTTTARTAGQTVSASYQWDRYTLNLGYSFNTGSPLALTNPGPVYLKCAPQSGGGAIIDSSTPYVQSLPITDDGKIYIYLGQAYSASEIELLDYHPVYYHDGTKVALWTDTTLPDAVSGTDDGTNWTTITIGGTTRNIPSGGGGLANYDFTHTANTVVNTSTKTIIFAADERCSQMITVSNDIGISVNCLNSADNYIWVANSGASEIDVTFVAVTHNGVTVNDMYVPDGGITVPAGGVAEIGLVCNADGCFITSRCDLTL